MGIIDDLRAFLVSKRYLRNNHDIAEDQSLLNAGLIDSLAVLELSNHIEQVYGVQVSEDDLVPENFDSLAAIKAFIDRKIAERGA
jgi:acyl carrier protein